MQPPVIPYCQKQEEWMLEKEIHRTAQKKTEAAPEQTSRVKMALLIFAYFIKIGSFTFGSGWSILAQMEQEFVDKRRWLTKQELLELVAVGKSLPGIMITNITMLFGYQMAGVLGGVLAVLGIALPAVVVLSLVTLAYDAINRITGSGPRCRAYSAQWCPSSAGRPSRWAKRP